MSKLGPQHVPTSADVTDRGRGWGDINSVAETCSSVDDTPPLISSLMNEMQTRWSRGERPLCDEYLSAIGTHSLSESEAVDLIYCEYALRQTYGLFAAPASFLTRFPQYREALQRQFELDAALDSACQTGSPAQIHAEAPPVHPLLQNQPLPASLGRYLVVAPVDSGGQADVYLGLHPTLRKNVILKLGRRPIEEPTESEEIQREGRILASLEHDTLVRVYDVDVIQGYPLSVMEYVAGPSLDQKVRQAPLPPEEAARLIATIARAVDYVHHQNLLHLDIKPRNILIDEHGRPRLIDFGLAKLDTAWIHEGVDDQLLSGTLQYMPPEQLESARSELRPAADVFALGGVFYFLLTGHPPYAAPTLPEMITLVRKGNWDQNRLNQAKIPAALKRICRMALEADPAKRFSSAAEFAEKLTAATTFHKHLSIGGVAASLLLIIIGSIWGLSRSSDSSPLPTTITPPGATSSASKPLLSLSVWDHDQFVELPNRLPLTNGDELQIKLNLPAGQSGLLLYCDGHDDWSILKQWPPQPRDQAIYYPSEETSTPLTGDPATQIFLFCATSDPQTFQQRIRERTASREANRLPLLNPYTLLYLRDREFHTENHSRGLGPPIQRNSTETTLKQIMREILNIAENQSASLSGIAFYKK